MDNSLQDVLPETLSFGDPITIHGLGILPILNDQPNQIIPPLLPLNEALEKGELRIREVSDGGNVPFLIVDNESDQSVILLEGQELFGGLQSRILNSTVLVIAHTSVRIVVSCVEQGRWGGSREFASGKALFRPSSRAIHKRGVAENLHREGIPMSHQGAVWNEVERSLREFGVHSRTSSFEDVEDRIAHRIEEFMEKLSPVQHQVGSIYFTQHGVIGTELVGNHDLFARLNEMITRSFAMEVLSAPPLNGFSLDPVHAFWQQVLACPYARHDSVGGVGDDIRTDPNRENLIGSGLAYNGTAIHFSCFPSNQHHSQPRRTATTRASVKDRRRNLRSHIEG